MMVAYHLCFDLSFFGVLKADFNHDLWWLVARGVIVSSFLFLAGISLTLARLRAGHAGQFLRRELKIGLCALAVSAGSYFMFPQSFIFFGILHFIFVASLIGEGLLRRSFHAMAFAILGAVSIALGVLADWPLFDTAPLQWIGFVTHKPVTEDYVPLFPWLGVVFLGIACSTWLQFGSPALGGRGLSPVLRWMGRHSLAIYMLHQPLLLGSLYFLTRR